MAIDITKYVSIVSGVGGASIVVQRSFGGRIYTENAAIKTDIYKEFTNLADVGTYFGTTSEEYARASLYFGWVSKSITQNKKLQFYYWDSANDTLTAVLTASVDKSNDFGSFLFIPATALTLTQVEEIATWNAAQNVMYMYCEFTTAANAATWGAALKGYAGLALTLQVTGEYQEMIPMIILGATNYDAINGTQNYMFQQFPTLTASVKDTPTSNTYDALRVNYIGQTQTAGQTLAFYQRGDLMGGATSPIAMNIYANEMWLKDAMSSSILGLLLALSKVSANTQGKAQLLSIIQSNINTAVKNGTISVGKTLTTTQQLYITNLTANDKAWHQVQSIGYYVMCDIQSYVASSGSTEYKAVYTLVYAKDDTVRAVDGTHILV